MKQYASQMTLLVHALKKVDRKILIIRILCASVLSFVFGLEAFLPTLSLDVC